MCSKRSPSSLRSPPGIHIPVCVRHEASVVSTCSDPSAWSMLMCAMNASGESGRPWLAVDQCVTNAKALAVPARRRSVTAVVS